MPTGRLRLAAELRLSGARITVGGEVLANALTEPAGFFRVLDGHRGRIDVGGWTFGLSGDGDAQVWVEDVEHPRVVVLELR